MKILIVTQKIDENDDILGFMHGWIAEFARHCEKVTAVCLQKGGHSLPANVSVLSLGKEEGGGRLKFAWRFFKYIISRQGDYNKVFVHMNSEYIVLAGWLWLLLGKKVYLWYAHGYAPIYLKIAQHFCDLIFTSTKSGCRLPSKKIRVVGQGIDTERFKKVGDYKIFDSFSIISIGRISPSKDYETLIGAAEILFKKGLNFKMEIIGGAGLSEQEGYFRFLKEQTEKKGLRGIISFTGPVSHRQVVDRLQSADLFVNMSQTGSLDKAMVEAMACELPILTCNEAMSEVLGDFRELLMYPKKDIVVFARKIEWLINIDAARRRELGGRLRQIVLAGHSLEGLIGKMINLMR